MEGADGLRSHEKRTLSNRFESNLSVNILVQKKKD